GQGGHSVDWRIAREVSRRCPVMVAGGLTPANVGGLISTVRPRGVDVSSGVEIGGEKDTQLIQAFIDAVRKAEQEIRDAEDEDA
ncbi:MAG TPA: bifunctional indole-3-glycerol phosphate synthase/phosphoribosylanthranilate isomerase, partial [Dehalococcoidia bacterium]|nr:bifunctional indole-3-glycerol phosphate synthase/phosphoribosylanthranilate isomerase [Dehalococcoidia bacterium]